MKTDNHQPVKKNMSSLQVLKTLQVLLQGNYTMAELVKILNENEKEPVFNNSVISKYINTCRFCGINILKINNRYYVSGMPFGMDITDKEKKLINILNNTVKNKMSARAGKLFSKFLTTLSKYSNKEIICNNSEARDLTIEAFEKAINDGKKIRIIQRTGNVSDVIPIEVVDAKNRQYFSVLDNNKENLINIKNITGIQILNENFKEQNTKKTVLYKLKKGLAARYQIRENETVQSDNLPECITIANHGENEELLFSRLLRYDSLCEIEHPTEYRLKMKQIINETLANYGEE